MMVEDAYILSLGASTPVGRDGWSSAAAVRAGISGFAEHPYVVDTAGEPVRIALAPWLDPDASGTQRFKALLYPAINQALEPTANVVPGSRVALALALPNSRPGLPADLAAELLKAVRSDYRSLFAAVAAFPRSHAAGVLALEAAIDKLSKGIFDVCVLAGVDSYSDPETLDWLEECEQLHGAGKLNNAWGFIPGEGAGAITLARGSVAEQLGAFTLAQIVGTATSAETNLIKTESICTGEALTQAFRGALRSLSPGETVTDVYCDMNGEPYRADEYGFSCLRTKDYFKSASDFIAPADCWGDVGAAGVPLHLALAALAGSKGYSNGGTAFVWASSEQGERGAVVTRVRTGEQDAR